MDDATGGVATPGYRVVQGVHCEVRLHPIADGVTDDAAGEQVLDRVEVEPALVGSTLCDAGQPQFVDVVGGEVALHKSVVDRRSKALPVLAPLLAKHGEPLVVSVDPPRRPLAHHFTRFGGPADQEPVAEFGIISVAVQQGVGAIRLDQFGLGDRLFAPAVVGLARELQDPQGGRDGDPVSSELAHDRVDPFPGKFS